MSPKRDPDEAPATPSAAEPADEEGTSTRRLFVGAFGLVAAGAVAGAATGVVARALPKAYGGRARTSVALTKPPVPGADRFGKYQERWVATSCAQCPAGCGIRVRVVEGRAVRIEGNPGNPLNRGGIGPRGLSGLQALYDPDRIVGPLVREGGKLVPISWENAIAMVVERLGALRSRKAPHELLVMTGSVRGVMHELFGRFGRAFGTPNFVDGSCGRSTVLMQAMEATLGVRALPSFAWQQARYVLSLEAGFMEDSCQSVYLSRITSQLRRGDAEKRTTIVHAGPTFDLTAHNADDWIRIRPGTGGALALGLCHVLLRDRLVDSTMLAARSKTFDAFAQWVKTSFPPERVVEICGNPGGATDRWDKSVGRLETLAHRLAERRPSFAFMDERALAYTNGLDNALAMLALNALLGALGRLVRVEPQPPWSEWPSFEPDAIATAGLEHPRLDRAGTPDFPGARSVIDALPDAFASGGRPSVVLLDHANPVWARAQPARWKQALEAVGFVVSFSPFRDETVESVAHLVLPDHTYLERYEDAASAPGVGIPVAGVRQPVIEPLHDTRSTGDVLIEIARRLGDPMRAAFPWPGFREALEARLRGIQEARTGSIIVDTQRAFTREIFEQGYWAGETPSYIDAGHFDLQTSWSPPEWAGDEKTFPLSLLAYRPQGYAEGSGANLPWLRFLRSRPGGPVSGRVTPVFFHPADAPGVEQGQQVRVVSPFGSIVAEACPDRLSVRGFAAIPLLGGHSALGRFAGWGSNVRDLLRANPAPRSGASMYGSARVRLEPVEGAR